MVQSIVDWSENCSVEENTFNKIIKVAYDQISEKNDNIGKISEKEVVDFLLEKLNELEREFEFFLFDDANYDPNNSSYLNGSRSILSKIVKDDIIRSGRYNILSFNYTDPWNRENKNKNKNEDNPIEPPLKSGNVHGKALEDKENEENRIIFGIDSKNISPESLEYRFTKVFRTLKLYSAPGKEGQSFNKNVFDKSIKVLKFYGHSLAEADYSYFQQMFDFYDLYHNDDLTLIFYFSQYGNRSLEELLHEQVTSVTRLIEKYGTTMDNQNHGKNLLTRLQQTKRIYIKEI